MVVGSNQPYFLPYLAYWQLINHVDVYVISDSMQYIKKGYINRNNILIEGKAHRFSLEVLGVNSKSSISEVRVGNNRKKLLKSFFHSYKKAPYFEEVYPLIESIVLNEEENLGKYVGNAIEKVAAFLGISTQFIYLSTLQGETTLKTEKRTIDICKRVEAKQFINAIGGVELYSRENFLAENIELKFLKMDRVSYKQFNNEFVPCLSIIDIMMFNSKSQIEILLKKFTLV